jgi:hypothetical protein
MRDCQKWGDHDFVQPTNSHATAYSPLQTKDTSPETIKNMLLILGLIRNVSLHADSNHLPVFLHLYTVGSQVKVGFCLYNVVFFIFWKWRRDATAKGS